jgi:RNA polymerase sigma factor (sigma-70 family)
MNPERQDEDRWENLISAVRRGAPEAIRIFAGRLEHLLFRFFCSLGLRSDEAEDLSVTCVTEITLKLVFKSDGFHGGNFVGWAFTVARRVLIDQQRRQPDLISVAPDVLASITEAAASAFEEAEPSDLEIAVLNALSQLADVDRQLLVARWGRVQVAFDAIGRELGISTVNARVRYARALVKLKKLLMADERVRKWLGRRRRPPRV